MRRAAIILGFLAVAGCSTTPPVIAPAVSTADAMIGLTDRQVLAGLGRPAHQTQQGQLQLWTYIPHAAAKAAGAATGGNATRRSCSLDVTFNAGRVSNVAYRDQATGAVSWREECAVAAESCPTSMPARAAGDGAPPPPSSAPLVAGGSQTNCSPIRKWQQAVLARIQPFMHWPPSASGAIRDGEPQLAITIDRQGKVLGTKIIKTSGYDVFDRDAVSIFQRAGTLPPPPAELPGDPLTFEMTITYHTTEAPDPPKS
jgi:TonB family protein